MAFKATVPHVEGRATVAPLMRSIDPPKRYSADGRFDSIARGRERGGEEALWIRIGKDRSIDWPINPSNRIEGVAQEENET